MMRNALLFLAAITDIGFLQAIQWLVSSEIMLLIWTILVFGWLVANSKTLMQRIVLVIVMLLFFMEIFHAGGGITGMLQSVPNWILSPDVTTF